MAPGVTKRRTGARVAKATRTPVSGSSDEAAQPKAVQMKRQATQAEVQILTFWTEDPECGACQIIPLPA